MHRMILCLTTLLALFSGSIAAQCAFNHSPWGELTLVHPEQIHEVRFFYPGEYLTLNLREDQCYRFVVIDTLSRPLALTLSDSTTREAFHSPSNGPATVLHWLASGDVTARFWLSAADCQAAWQPITLLIEWTKPGTPCPSPPAWPADSLIFSTENMMR